MVSLFVLRPFSCIFIKIASFRNIPFRLCAIFYKSTHASDNFKTVIHVSIFHWGHFSLWAFFPGAIFPCGHFSLWSFFPVVIFPCRHFSCGLFCGHFSCGLFSCGHISCHRYRDPQKATTHISAGLLEKWQGNRGGPSTVRWVTST